MTVSLAGTKMSLVVTALGLVALTGCADVGGSNTPSVDDEFPVVKSTDENVIICQSIRVAMQKDRKAADQARAAGNAREAAIKMEAFQAGVTGASTVPDCDVSDLTGTSSSAPASAPAPAVTVTPS